MVSSCCICSKENVPSEPHRSFHRIPANEEMRNKWFHIIGRTVSYKGARICSDHFMENDFDINPYSKIIRLKNTAVPSVNLQKEKIIKTKSLPYQKTSVNSCDSGIMFQNENDIITLHSSENQANVSNDINEPKESENTSNVLIQNTSENLIVFLKSDKEINATYNEEKIDAYFESNINDMNRERNFPSPILENSEIRNEKVLKFSKHNTVRFTKTDFPSDEKWAAFLKCIAYNKRENRIMRQRNKCLRKKILILQGMLQDLLKKV